MVFNSVTSLRRIVWTGSIARLSILFLWFSFVFSLCTDECVRSMLAMFRRRVGCSPEIPKADDDFRSTCVEPRANGIRADHPPRRRKLRN